MTTYSIDNQHTAANFSIRHLMVSNVRGQLGKTTGTIEYDSQNPESSKVNASIDLSGINTNEPQRDQHLKSSDFFDIEKYPAISFESTKWVETGDKAKITGNLTIHGITNSITLDVEISPAITDPYGKRRIGAQATGKLSRKDYGLTWNMAIEAGGFAVGDEVKITLDIEGVA